MDILTLRTRRELGELVESVRRGERDDEAQAWLDRQRARIEELERKKGK